MISFGDFGMRGVARRRGEGETSYILMGHFLCNAPASGWKYFVLKAWRVINSRSAVPGWRKDGRWLLDDTWESNNWLTTNNYWLFGEQRVWRTSAAKIARCTDLVGFGALLPNGKLQLSSSFVPAFLPGKLYSCNTGRQPSLDKVSPPPLQVTLPTLRHTLPYYVRLSFTRTSLKATRLILALLSFYAIYNKY